MQCSLNCEYTTTGNNKKKKCQYLFCSSFKSSIALQLCGTANNGFASDGPFLWFEKAERIGASLHNDLPLK